MPLQITKRWVNSTIILELRGRITLGEGSTLLRNIVREVVDFDRPRSVILDISGAKAIDSSGIGELVSAYTVVRNRLGVGVSLCHPLIKILDLLQITKLATVFEMATSVEQVLSGVRSKDVSFACPVETCQAWSLIYSGIEYQACSRCKSRYRLKAGSGIDHMLMDSYPGEFVSFNPMGTPTITTAGPVDLFVTNMFRRAWLAMDRKQRSAIFDLTPAREITELAVWELLRVTEDKWGGIGLIVIPASHLLSRIEHPAICTELRVAIAKLGGRSGSELRTAFLN